MLKDIVVPLTGSASDNVAVSVAMDLAQPHAAFVRIVLIADLPPPNLGAWDMIPPASLVAAQDMIREQAAQHVDKIRSRVAAHAANVTVEVLEAQIEYPGDLAASLAYAADLSVIAGWAGAEKPDPRSVAYFNSLLFSSGRPVLVVPPRCKTPLPPKCIVVGWTPTPHSCRALHDAIPFMQGAHTVHLVQIDPDAGDLHEDSALTKEILAHLGRHRIQATSVKLHSKGHLRSALLLNHAREVKAGLVVMGGYGHSRLREWSIGGMTRELLANAMLPVLYSH
jgi:nucleotide-binding universal stress UspA family protein